MFPWPAPSASVIQTAWQRIQELPHTHDDDPRALLSLIIRQVAETVLGERGFTLFEHHKLDGVNVDFVGTMYGLRAPSSASANWLGHVVDSPPRSMITNLCQRLRHMHMQRVEYEPLCAVMISYNGIRVVYVAEAESDDDQRPHHVLRLSPAIPFLSPWKWRLLSQPTRGFELLCHSLKAIDSYERPPMVTMNGEPMCVHEILSQGRETPVYVVDQQVIKTGSTMCSALFLHGERKNHDKLWASSSQMKEYMIPLLPVKADQYGLVMPRAQPLREWMLERVERLCLGDETVWSSIQQCVLGFLRACHTLHSLGYAHADIRAGNLVMFEERARLIDWTILHRLKGKPDDDAKKVRDDLQRLMACLGVASLKPSKIFCRKAIGKVTAWITDDDDEQHVDDASEDEYGPVIPVLARIRQSMSAAGFEFTREWVDGCAQYFPHNHHHHCDDVEQRTPKRIKLN